MLRSPSRRDLGMSYKSAFVLLHKLREAMAEEMKGRVVGGEGKVAEVDGGYFGGYVKPANLKENRIDRRFTKTKTASARLSSLFASAAAIRFRPYSLRRPSSDWIKCTRRQRNRCQRRRSARLGTTFTARSK